jgi:hypothetical protein
MHLVLLLFIVANNQKTVEVRYTEIAPNIDGVIEEAWQKADSACNFVQHIPYEKTEPTEKTVVYLLQDKDNLYIAFRCHAVKNKPFACFTRDEDYVRVSIDPFGSKTTGYFFTVFASELFWDGWIFDDGRTYDDSWEGVWYQAVELYDDHVDFELKIPFKSIRYKEGLSEWRIQFMRHIAANLEDDYWTEVTQQEDDRISKWGLLRGINAQTSGYYFELYPETYVRYDNFEGEEGKLKPRVSMNFKWDVTPQTTLNATFFPDFAQIESDPFTLNLSRYPTYLGERRPFFVEGMDIFRLSDFGDMGFFQRLNIFYSRRIGKSINGEVVPIIGGFKLTNKSEDWNIGALGTYTDEYSDTVNNIEEPHRWFGVFRAKRRVFDNSDIGVLFSGTMVDKDERNYVLGIDGVYRKNTNQLIIQGAVSDMNGKMGWAFNSGYFGFIKNFITFAAASVINDSFDVSDVGFVPWVGEKRFMLMTGPYVQLQKGTLRNYFIAAGPSVTQEPGDSNWSILGNAEINGQFRNNWGFDFNVAAGHRYEADTNYLNRAVNLSVWGTMFGNFINFGCNYSYSYNYWRGFLGYQGNHWFSYMHSFIPPLSAGFSSNLWVEWDTLNSIIAMTSLFRPRMDIRFTADVSMSIFDEIVMQTPETDFGSTEFLSNRLGLLFSWNFLPKSWLYVALNDYRAQDEQGELQPQYQIGALKIKYLLYF